nr:unnamed protein product [Callosobruchus analis]
MDIEHLVKKRGILKGKLTHFEKYIDTLELDISSNTVIDKIHITELQQRTERLNKVLDDFEEIQNEIEGLASQTSQENSAKICCPFCKGSHNIFYCAQFLKLTVKDRMSKVKHLKLCINCLRGNHEVNTCRFGNCKICNSKHNSILHDSQQTQSTTVQLAVGPFEQSDAPTDEAITEPTTCAVATGSRAILSTVLIDVLDKHHKKHPARALLDCGSQSSFISKDLADTLNLDKHKTSLCISGISNNLSYSHLKCVVKLRKWRSNRPETIQQFSDTSESKSLEFSLNKEHEFKTLGLSWNSENDSLNYKIHPNKQTSGKVTKRIILSKIASIFDPLALLGPCIILAKILLQKLWLEKLTWDESLPYNLHQRWLEFSSQMDSLNSLHIPRKVTCNDAVKFELHAFSDASEQAYGACVFIKSLNARGECSVNLLCAKSKVAPLKTLTMPRLELCAALTLARMVSKISESVEIKFEKIYCWSDSSIVLAWLRTSPSLLKPFVDSRVAEIQKLTESFVWKHVSTKDNPADLLSRGVRPEAIQDCALWWFGPTWLKSDQDLWPNPQHLISDLPELRKTLKVVIIDQNVINFERFSSLARLKRSFAYLLRFIKNSKKPKPERHLGQLSTSEINDAFHSLIRISQLLSFPSDYQRLKEGNNLSSSSRILSLSPFMDRDGLIRVGGRLKNSNLPYCRKHPILLNSSHHLTKLIIRKAHLDLLHAGTEQVLSHVRETFWPISGRSVARQVVKKCVTCAKFSTIIVQPHFWSRWSKNYLSELQQRRKWKMTNGDITIGQLVLIRDDHLPPMKWRLGRVDSMIVGSDGLSRVARIKTAEGIFSRAINRLCPLPIESTDFQPRAHVHDNHVPESGTPDSTTATPPGERETTKKTDIESKPAHRSI